MAQNLQTTFGSLTIPGAYSNITYLSQPTGISANGVLFLIGEADQGAAWGQETLPLNQVAAFGPGQSAAVAAKYGSGRLVNAYRAACNPSADPAIPGSPNQIFLIKTNAGAQASLALPNLPSGTYATLLAQNYGLIGSSLNATITATAEVVPTTGTFTWINNVGAINTAARVSGGSQLALTITANATPATFQGLAWNAGLSVTGGASISLVTVTQEGATVTVSGVSGNTATFTISTTWNATPTAGDTLYIPSGSALDNSGGGHTLCGAYVVTSATASVITATKLSDANRTGAVAGTITAPTTAGSPFTLAATTDMQDFGPVTISRAASAIIEGVGKSLELSDLATGADQWVRYAFVKGTTTPVSWISLTATPTNIASGTEYATSMNIQRASDATNETVAAGGTIAMVIGYKGTTGSITISATTISTSVTGGSGANLSIPIGQFNTIKDLATYINTQTGYTCAVGTTVIGQQSPTVLDQVSAAGICSDEGAANGRIKMDGQLFYNAMKTGSVTTYIASKPALGLPNTLTQTFLSGGTKGASSTAQFLAAIDAIQSYIGNFVVPCISQNATVANGFGSTDVALGATDSSSTYVAQTVMAYANTHCLLMSKAINGRHRQAFASSRDTFINSQNNAASIGGFRTSMTFQDVNFIDSSGNLVQHQPWLAAVIAAGMQAAGFYRPIVLKKPNVVSVVQAAGDFNPLNQAQITTALQAGLLPITQTPQGAWVWQSDQTTYGADTTTIPNSIQAVYAADIMAVDLAQSMTQAFVGQSVADVTASGAMTFLTAKMAQYLRLKLISTSADALKGFRNASITLAPPAMLVQVEAKLATGIYFVPINLYVSTVTQTATQ